MKVSIHATLAGGDLKPGVYEISFSAFLSTPPSRVATLSLLFPYQHLLGVSIHATLAGGDQQFQSMMNNTRCFYPRHPRGWRPRILNARIIHCTFLSTPPSRVATD